MNKKIYKNSECLNCVDKFVGCGKTSLKWKIHPISKVEVLLCVPCYAILENKAKGK